MDALDLVSMIAEVITWIAFGLGGACLLVAVMLRLVDGTWEPTDAVVVDGESGLSTVRWFAEGEFHQRHLSAEERAHVTTPDDQAAFYRRHTPDRLRLERVRPIRRVFATLTIVLLGIGAIATVVSVIVTLVG
ncbi:MAG TPA: hypothetical protein VKA62_06520 [Agromyces sp.]|nr:hypothetical protein [Agromyces sp.]